MNKVLLFSLFMLFSISASYAQDKKEGAKPEDSSVRRIMLAHELAKYGYETYSSSALIEAATILSSIQTQGLDGISYEQGKAKDNKSEQKKEAITVEKLLKDAKEFATGDEALLILANRVSSEAKNTRGAVGGPRRGSSIVYGNTADTYTISFKSGIPAEIAVSGDGSSDLDLYVYDENGNLLVSDDDYSDDCYVCWTPRWTGRFYIKIVNQGIYSNAYNFATN